MSLHVKHWFLLYQTLVHTHATSHIVKWHTVYRKTAHQHKHITGKLLPGSLEHLEITCAHDNTEIGGSYPQEALCESHMPLIKVCTLYTAEVQTMRFKNTGGHVLP